MNLKNIWKESDVMKAPKIIWLKDWLSLHCKLLKEDKMAAYMQCCFHKLKYDNEVIICNVNSIPEGYTVEDVVNIINGKHIDL